MSAVNAEKIQKGFKNMSDFINEPEEMEPVEIEGTEETAGEVTDSTEETPTAETVSKFRELTSNRMKMIGQQLFQRRRGQLGQLAVSALAEHLGCFAAVLGVDHPLHPFPGQHAGY